jgi:RND family efflux transporter MFP subunit
MDRHNIVKIVTGTALLGTALAMTARSDTPSPPDSSSPAPRRIEVAAVTISDIGRRLELAGVTRASDRAQLSFPIPARVSTRPVEVGDRVRRGQVLASLDDHEFRLAEQASSAALAELEIRLAQAQREEQRTARLAAAEAATAEELEQNRAAASALAAARDAAAARLAETRRLLAESTLEAPFSGTVTAVHVEPGEWAAPGQPILELAGEGAVEIMLEVPESAWSRLDVGREVEVSLPFLAVSATGQITRLAGVAGGPGGLFPVEITIRDRGDIVSGLAAEVVLPLESRPQLTVPMASILNPGSSRPAVFRITGGRAQRIEVEIGEVIGERIAVTGALEAGDSVAVSGHTALADNEPVEVV